MEGHTLGGRYQLNQELGSSGFGQTYLAQDSHRPGQPWVVVKHLRPHSSDPEVLTVTRRLFQQEAKILEQLGSHDCIPCLLAYFEEGAEFYLVEEWIEGDTLEQALQNRSPWPEVEVRALLKDILQTLAFVHQQGVTHRNLKPANLIRRQTDGRWVLIDFGAVKQVTLGLPAQAESSRGSSNYTIGIGSPGYMPSEQLGGNPRLSSDLYALGLIALQALSGLPPQKVFRDPLTGELRWHDLASASAPFTAFLDRMLCCDWRQRFSSAVEALEALQALPELALPTANTEILPNPAPAAWDPLQEPTTPPRSRPSLRARLQVPPAWLGGVLAASGVLTLGGLWQIRSGFGSFPGLNSQTAPVQEASTLRSVASRDPSLEDRIPSPASNSLVLSPGRWANALRLQATLEGPAAITALAISPDGTRLASGGDDGLVKLWDPHTGERLETLVGHEGSIETLAISPDGTFLVSAGADRTVRVWDLNTLSERLQLQGHTELINSLAISPDSRWIASGSADRTIRLWQADSGQLLRTIDATAHEKEAETGVTSVTFGPGRTPPTRVATRRDAPEDRIPLAPTAVILAAAHADPTIHLWDPVSGTLLDTLEADYPVEQVLLSQDGRYLLSGSANGVSIWNLSTGSLERKLSQNFASLATLTLSPDGRLIASGTDHRAKEIKLWDLRTGELLRTLGGHTWTVSALLFSPDGQTLFSGGVDGSIRIWGPTVAEPAEDEP
ncbi:serine/threonine-protein kinase [Thermostichus vulcanus]|uniref:Serine/threonine protein kinase n=1 Tax=Thermostichus vulcanus str. 'Rupite' TaxID=2813851 RepID=A0ABT0CCZ4_THEVL|nr:serine/threonine-protein kinase [Thermostichus vulcanus]MCJ2543661.1 serine/threonine protein kinase [Thermostichus vulcanus str. 'Rupite']